jgi:ATP-dependent RNA helicase RhlE
VQRTLPSRLEAAIPEIPSFIDLGLSPAVAQALKMRGIAQPFEIQASVLPDALAGRDILARSRTGSGKTLAFAAPMVERLTPSGQSPTGLVLTPTRELASQVMEDFRAIADVRRLHVATVYGGVGIAPQAKRARHADIVVATPGRLLDLVARRLLRLDRVRIVVLDEADRMLDMGFLPDVQRILELLRPERQTMLFSATLDGAVGRLATRFTRNAVLHEVGEEGSIIAEALHRFIGVEQPRKTDALIRELATERGLALVFVRTKHGADRLAKRLRNDGFRAGELHGGMSQPQRERALGKFASGANDILVATDVAARGLDLDDITHVINFDPPADEKDYIHRVGRTARAGRGGEGITFVTPIDWTGVRLIANKLDLHVEFAGAGAAPVGLRSVPSGNGRRQPQGSRPRTSSGRPQGQRRR